jgi:FMN phosphatase YigB (HAD superfamily)
MDSSARRSQGNPPTGLNQVTDAPGNGSPRYAPTFALSAAELETLLSEVHLLSVDVFGTLLLRQCVAPEDVFSLVERRLGRPGFRNERISAEAKVRRGEQTAQGREASLAEIYSLIDDAPSREALAKAELSVEASLAYVNPCIGRVIETAQRMGKRVVAVSDTHLSSEEVTRLLVAGGVVLDAVYTSSDFRAEGLAKHNRLLFERVCRTEGVSPKFVLHIGCDTKSDVSIPNSIGMRSVLCDRIQLMISRQFPHVQHVLKSQPDLSTSLVAGTILRHEANLVGEAESPAETFGYHFGGPLLAGFIKFILDLSAQKDIRRLVLLARDGVIVGKALDILQPKELSWRVVPCSRRMAVFPRFQDAGWSGIQSLFQNSDGDQTPENFLKKLGLLDVISLEGISDRKRPAESIAKDLETALIRQARLERDALNDVLREDLHARSRGEKFAWVDVGWALTSTAALNTLIGDPAPGFFVGSHEKADPFGEFWGYLFERGQPEDVSDGVMAAPEIIELLFSDPGPSFLYSLPGGGEVITRLLPKSGPERVRDMYVASMQRGALSFIRDLGALFHDLDCEELREYNRQTFVSLFTDPTPQHHGFLSSIPHDAKSGGTEWALIGESWRPRRLSQDMDGLRAEILRLRGQPFATALELFRYRFLKSLSAMSPPLPSRMARRFRKSAEKRNPFIVR